jgi:hypothetical protein
MSRETVRALFDNWERVWNDDQHGLIAECVADVHIRHDGAGTRQMTPQQYLAEIVTAKQNRPNTRVFVYDHKIGEDHAWFRFGLTWSDAVTGGPRSRAGLALWRIEQDRMAESWLSLLALGSTWPDVKSQKSWTSR